MKTNDTLHGFVVRYVQELPELKATLYRLEYQKNGADLVWLDRSDDNKTFAIAFKTIPQDDTGVFHILEHSVLCGSEKYPVKEPFVELLKSSLQTFLNAFTFPDKTMYPVCSRNDQDFLNLIDVYLDAVLHPLSISDPHAFRQEGWHYELEAPEGELKCNGVVYNEMKGEFASADSVLSSAMDRLLFPDTCYGYVSGGHPQHITDLTYENYLASHHRFYHPSNARIFLDGSMDLDAVLSKLDSFLCIYDRLEVDADIPMQPPVSPAEQTEFYEIDPEEDDADKVILAKGWVFGSFEDLEKNLAMSILSEVLCGSNESPLKKALLEAGLAEDVEIQVNDGIQQLYLTLVVRNTALEKKERVWKTVEETLEDLVRNGLDRKRLHAVLNYLEFSIREKDYGTMPRGLVYAIASMDSWLYGGDPAQNLCYDQVFRSLRAKVEEGWFEQMLRECLLENPHQAKLVLEPSKTLGEEKQAKERARLSEIRSGWSREQAEQVIRDFQALRERQERPDEPEKLAMLPVLSLKDIPERVEEKVGEKSELDGVTVLHQGLDTNGIVYLELYFSLADIPLEEMGKVKALGMLGRIATEHYSPIELCSELESNLGRFSVAPVVFAEKGQTERCAPYLKVAVSVLESRMPEAVRLVDEVLNRSDFTDTQFIYHLLRQSRLGLEQSITMSGDSYAAQRVAASFSAKGAVNEAFQGIDNLRWLQKADREFEDSGKALCDSLAQLCAKLFVRERLTVSVTGPKDDAQLSTLIGCLNSAPMGAPVTYEKKPVCREGFQIPAEVGFAAKAGNLNDLGARYSGSARVAAQLLTLDYLWNTIRVKGGAYGTRLGIRSDGDVSITSYRDPSPAQSLNSFDQVGQALRDFCSSGQSLDKYIISTIGDTQPVLTPRLEGVRMAALYFGGRAFDESQLLHSEILHTDVETLRAVARVLDEVCAEAGACVIGGKSVLDACELDQVEPIQI